MIFNAERVGGLEEEPVCVYSRMEGLSSCLFLFSHLSSSGNESSVIFSVTKGLLSWFPIFLSKNAKNENVHVD